MPASENALIHAICSLRSLRRYRDEPVPEAVLHDILEAGRWCGSAINGQPWQFVVVHDRETRVKLSSLNPYAEFFGEAPVCIVVLMEEDAPALLFDAGRVTQNLLLAAQAHGVGSGNAWLRLAEHKQAALDILRVPPGYQISALIALGYPAPGDPMEPTWGHLRRPIAPMLGRKPLTELVHYDHFGQRQPAEQGRRA
jgi:nitroreductase